MRVGLFVGLGPGADPQTIVKAARAAERTGFSSLWSGEHVAHFEPESSPYPYTPDGSYPLSPEIDLLDPFIAQTWAAAATTTLRVGTAVAIVGERQPVVLAKQIASIDHLSGGRFTLGAGLGWSKTEYEACGVPWERRGARLVEYVEAMRSLWASGPSTFEGEFVSFTGAYCHPTPVRGRDLPVHFGGGSEQALRRVARYGNGWHALNVTPDEVRASVATISDLAEGCGRSIDDIEIVVGPTNAGGGTLSSDEMRAYRDAGVDELSVIDVYQPSADEAGIEAWVENLARTWVQPAREVGARDRDRTFARGRG